MAVLFHTSLAWLTFGRRSSLPEVLLLVALAIAMGMGGLTVLHHGGHKRFAQNKLLNSSAVHVAIPVGFWVEYWGEKHRLHHSRTAIYPVDSFTSGSAALRLHPDAPRRRWHSYQHVYIWLAYALFWAADQASQLRFLFRGRIPYSSVVWPVGKRLRSAVVERSFSFLVLVPYLMNDAGRTVGSLAMAGTASSCVVGAIVGLGHINSDLQYPTSQERRQWKHAVLESTASFNADSRFVGWLTGGMTMHAAHHVRPLVARRDLRALHRELRQSSAIVGAPIIVEFRSLSRAVIGHVLALQQLGTTDSRK